MKRQLLFSLLVLGILRVSGQSYTITTTATTTTLWSTTAVSALTFGFKNTNPYPIKITNVSTYCPAVAVTYTLFYNPTVISGPPGVMGTTNGWIQASPATTVTPAAVGVTQILSGLSLIVPANTIYRLAIQTSNNGPYYATASTSPDFVSAFGAEIYTQANPVSQSYTGPVTGLTTTPRGFYGSVTFEKYSDGFNNASVSEIVSPKAFCSTSQPVTVKIRNAGINRINSVAVNWEVDAVPQTPFICTTMLDTSGGSGINDTTITLGTLVFTPGVKKSLRIWTSDPNSGIDTTNSNDTVYGDFRTGLSGTYTINPFSADYTSIGEAVSDLNRFGICGPVTFNVDAGTTYTENPIVLSQTGTATNTIVFQKNGFGANPVVYGKNGKGTLDAVIALNGVDYITFDGIDVSDSISNATATTQMEYGYGIVNSSSTRGSKNNIIRNCKVTLKRANTATIGIAQSTLTAASSLAGANHNNRYENIRVENSYGGILLQGTPAFPDSSNIITSSGTDTTCIGSASTSGDIGAGTAVVTGINLVEQRNVEVSKCIVRNLSTASTGYSHGIWLNNTTTTSNYGSAKIFNNQIYGMVRTTAASAAASSLMGIRIDVGTLGSARVYNNIIHSITATNTAHTANSVTIRGIAHGISVLTGSAEFYYNSVHLNNTNTFTAIAAFTKAATAQATVRNNIFSVTSVAQTANPKHYAVYINVTTPNIVSSNNVLWSSQTANGFAGYGGATLADRASLQAFAASISPAAPSNGNETGSAFANPNFTSATDLTFSTATPAAVSGIPVAGYTTDILGNVRSTTAPTIGAYETTQPLFDSSAPVISNIVITNAITPVVYATINDNSTAASAGNVILWYRVGASGTFTPVSPDSVPVGSLNGNYKWAASLSSLPTGAYQFYIAARDLTGSGSNISVNPIQNVSFTSFSSVDPVNFGAANPDPAANTRLFVKMAPLAGGIYTVGPTGTYAKLTSVVNLLNASELTGHVVFELEPAYNGTIGESFPLILNSLGYIGGPWTVTIRPQTGATALLTSGDPGSGFPLITFNGADRVILDGRPGGAGTAREWTIRNTRSAATLSPAIQFMNDAQKDTLEYLNIESGNTTAAGGTVVISTTTEAVGNDAIVILNNKIRDRSDSLLTAHANAIYITGTAPVLNDDIVIDGNELLNFTGIGVAATAAGNGSGWRINNNHLYNNLAAASTTAQTGISFLAASNNNQINNNYIGGSTVNAGGAKWSNTGANAFIGITAAFDTVQPSTISGNVVANITKSATGAANFTGIINSLGKVTISGNVIGDTVNANSILNAGTGVTVGISVTNTSPGSSITIDNNRIANITATNAATGAIFRGISYTAASGNPVCHARFNKIFNIINTAATTGYAAGSIACNGIYYFPTGYTFNCEIKNNTIYNLADTNSVSTNPTNVSGITLTNTHGTIANNVIYNISNYSKVGSPVPSTANGLYFRFLETGTLIINNMISLNGNPSDSVQMNGVMITGANGGAHGYAYNSIRISNPTGSPVKSFAFHRGENSTATQSFQPVAMKNNLFINEVTSPGTHYAVGSEGIRPDSSWLINENDYNDFYTLNSGNTGLWGTASVDLAGWKSVTGGDPHSVQAGVTFTNPSTGDLHLSGASIGNHTLAGRAVAGVTTDFDGQTRHTYPYMGADENTTSPLPVNLSAFTATKKLQDVNLNWTTVSENNTSHFMIERSVDGKLFVAIGKVKAAGNSSLTNHYIYQDKDAFKAGSVLYYRLKIADNDGTVEYSQTRIVRNDMPVKNISAYPNPFSDALYLSFEATHDQQAQLAVTSITGKQVSASAINIQKGQNNLPVDINALQPGMYILSLEIDGEKQLIKILKH